MRMLFDSILFLIVTALLMSVLTGCASIAGQAGAHPAEISCKGKGAITGQGSVPAAVPSKRVQRTQERAKTTRLMPRAAAFRLRFSSGGKNARRIAPAVGRKTSAVRRSGMGGAGGTTRAEVRQ